MRHGVTYRLDDHFGQLLDEGRHRLYVVVDAAQEHRLVPDRDARPEQPEARHLGDP